ncbi:hypothetical protein PPROV_000060200 [Pycnococcus provasolii]|uniref:Uncharacterized protein n=1 Tax=Pycnococcus provasolii TaxID=41880 RepID=A0A830H485_9CHLO|nr:hypothetical protein PPROV_000060200 [Pycnococcus provasolii]
MHHLRIPFTPPASSDDLDSSDPRTSHDVKLEVIQVPLARFSRRRNQNNETLDLHVFVRKYTTMQQTQKPGGIGILVMGGEGPLPGLPGGYAETLAEKYNAALYVAAEHRFYGNSLPTACKGSVACGLTTENLKHLNVQEALADHADVIKTFDPNMEMKWVAVGGSYSGGLSAWFRVAYPDLTVGALASSGVVNALFDFPQFDTAVHGAIDTNCAMALHQITSEVDDRLKLAHPAANIKKMFGAPQHLADTDFRYLVADAFSMGVQYGHKHFLCDSLLKPSPASDINELLERYVTWISKQYGSSYGAGCFYDAECIRDASSADKWQPTSRAWRWQKCTQVAYLQSAPVSSALRSPSLNLISLIQECNQMFGEETAAELAETNRAFQKRFGGDHPRVDHVFYSQFSDDPWREAGAHDVADEASCLAVCDGCGHCSDLRTPTNDDPAGVKACRAKFETLLAKKWLASAA